MRRSVFFAVSLAMLASSLIGSPTLAAGDVTIYSNLPNPVPGNVSSVSFEAQQMKELGDRIAFEPSTPRNLDKVQVLMSSQRCETGSGNDTTCLTTPGSTFSHPITLNIYAVGASNSVGALLESVTQTFNIPYRPSADVANCGPTGQWFFAPAGTCHRGFATPVVFDLSSLSFTAPDEVIMSVAYNTTHAGYNPIGEGAPCFTGSGCGYDSLNVGFADTATSVSEGSNPAPSDAYVNSASNAAYCDGGAGGQTFRLDAGCWGGLKPAFTVFTPPQPLPDIAVTPTSHNFGALTVNSTSAPSSFSVTNNGTADLTIQGVSLAGSNPGSFAIDTNGCAAAVLAPSDSCAIGVVFRPTSAGPKSAQLQVASDDPDTSVVSVALSGTGEEVATGSITIVLDTRPNGSQPFVFHASDGLGTFTLLDNGTGQNQTSFTLPAHDYDFWVTPVVKWSLVSLSCTTQEPYLHGLLTVHLQPGQNVTCTFVESYRVPDASIGLNPPGPFVGAGIYANAVLPSQTVNQAIARGQTRSFFVRLENRGLNQDRYRLVATYIGSANFKVTFWANGVNVTALVNAGTYRVTLNATARQIVEVRVTVNSSTPPLAVRNIDLQLQSTTAAAARDFVRAHVSRA